MSICIQREEDLSLEDFSSRVSDDARERGFCENHPIWNVLTPLVDSVIHFSPIVAQTV